MTDALWFGFITLVLPTALDRVLVRIRYVYKYKFPHEPIIQAVNTMTTFMETIQEAKKQGKRTRI